MILFRTCPRCGAERVKPSGGNIYVGIEYRCPACGTSWRWGGVNSTVEKGKAFTWPTGPTAAERQLLAEERDRVRAELARRRRA
jgi:hypothetical protein